jgi:hypothetical protein
MSLYGAAMFSTLVAHWERRHKTTPDDIAALKEEMRDWLNILTETANLLGTPPHWHHLRAWLTKSPTLGSGTSVSSEVRDIIERTIAVIENDSKKGHTPPTATPTSQVERSEGPASGVYLGAHTSSSTSLQNRVPFFPDSQRGHTPYPSLAYPEQVSANNIPAAGAFDPGFLYSTSAGQSAAASVAGAAQHTDPLVAYASQATQHVAHQAGVDATADIMWQQGNIWHDWTAAFVGNQDRYNATTALLTLGAGSRDGAGVSVEPAPAPAVAVAAGHAGQWPLVMFGDSQGT